MTNQSRGEISRFASMSIWVSCAEELNTLPRTSLETSNAYVGVKYC